MRFAFVILVLLVGVLATGCESAASTDSAAEGARLPSDGVPGPPSKPGPESPSTFTSTPVATATEIPYVPAPNPTRIARPVECKDRGYAGRALDDNSAVDTYWLTDPPESQADAAYAVAQALCNAGGWYIPQGEVRVWKADYSLRQLIDWHKELREIFWTVPGFGSHGVNQGINRIEYWVRSERAKEDFERKIAEMEVPREAIVVNVQQQLTVDEPPPMNVIEPGLELSIEVDRTVYTGQPIKFTVSVANTSDQPLHLEYGGYSPVDVVIYTEAGKQIWRHYSSAAQLLVLATRELAAGASTEFEVEWMGLDDYLAPLESGAYSVRAYFRVDVADSPYGGDMSTYPAPLQVLAP